MDTSLTKQNLTLWAMPALFLLIQYLPEHLVLGIVCLLLLIAVFIKSLQSIIMLLAFSTFGYWIWSFSTPLITSITDNPMLKPILGRFGLIGYIVIFSVWGILSKTKSFYLRLGDVKAVILLPFIWRGKQEPVWRFILIFCCICLVPLVAGFFINSPTAILGYGTLFTIVNALLEEIVWRGLILSRMVDLVGEKQALNINALTFGLYHISLGFPLWACLIFAVGGIYMGGAAIRSKGLLASFIMHMFVNLIFVTHGMIN